jgi:hypothetical protein
MVGGLAVGNRVVGTDDDIIVGSLEGEGVGLRYGLGVVGLGVGMLEGFIVGCSKRDIEGAAVIIWVGSAVVLMVGGLDVGSRVVGTDDDIFVGSLTGEGVGSRFGSGVVGLGVGILEGLIVGLLVGSAVGLFVGSGMV